MDRNNTISLNLALVQSTFYWEDKKRNLKHFAHILKTLKNTGADLVVLPEMFTTGFSMKPQNLFDIPEGETLFWLKDHAKQLSMALCGSAIIKENNHYYNRLYFVEPSGHYKTYDKRHLFSLAGEDKVYAAGKKKLILEYKGWKINPQICFDLRFPVWCRNDSEFDLQLFVANWPERRIAAWNSLLQARAIENLCYVAGVNRVGHDGNNVYHSGNSAVFNPLGKKISTLQAHQEQIEIVSLNKTEIEKTRAKFSFLQDRDEFRLIN